MERYCNSILENWEEQIQLQRRFRQSRATKEVIMPIEKLVPDQVNLMFDPATVEDPVLRAVLIDDVSRTIWVAYRWKHLVNQNFNDDCLQIAKSIKVKPPKSVEELAGRCEIIGHTNFRHTDIEFFRQLFPIIAERRTIPFTIKSECNGQVH